MKKTICFYGVWIAIMFAFEALNAAILLHLHPIGFYYTIEGLKLSMLMATSQAVFLAPFYLYTENKILLKKTYITRPN